MKIQENANDNNENHENPGENHQNHENRCESQNLCKVRIRSQQGMFVAQEDVKDFFYRIVISSELSAYVGLPPISYDTLARAFTSADLQPPQGLANEHGSFVRATLCLLPVGFSWASWFPSKCTLLSPAEPFWKSLQIAT